MSNTNKTKRLKMVLLILALLVLFFLKAQQAYALVMPDYVRDGFETVIEVTREPAIMYTIYFVLFIMVFYGLYSAALAKVKIFGGDDGLNKSGKMVCIGFTLLTVFGMFWYLRNTAIDDMLTTLPAPFIALGAVMLPLIIFVACYKAQARLGTRWKLVWILLSGIALVAFGNLVESEEVTSVGTLITFIGLIMLFVTLVKWFRNRSGTRSGPGRERGRRGRRGRRGDDGDDDDEGTEVEPTMSVTRNNGTVTINGRVD